MPTTPSHCLLFCQQSVCFQLLRLDAQIIDAKGNPRRALVPPLCQGSGSPGSGDFGMLSSLCCPCPRQRWCSLDPGWPDTPVRVVYQRKESLLQMRLVWLPGGRWAAHLSHLQVAETPLPSELCWLNHEPARTTAQRPAFLVPESVPLHKPADNPRTIPPPLYFHL